MVRVEVVLFATEKTRGKLEGYSVKKRSDYEAVPRVGEIVWVHDVPFTVKRVEHYAGSPSVFLGNKGVETGYRARLRVLGWVDN